jgi:hypothetical protein
VLISKGNHRTKTAKEKVEVTYLIGLLVL